MQRDQEYTGYSVFKALSDSNLVSLCIERNDAAWNEFFNRHLNVITSTIYETLKNKGYRLAEKDDEPVGDIRAKVIENLYHRGWLSKCVDPSGLEKWLKTVAYNQSIEWIREQRRQKEMPKTDSEDYKVSLDEPTNNNMNMSYGDTLASTFSIEDDAVSKEAFRRVFENMRSMERTVTYWVLRLSIMAQDNLSDMECADLADYTKQSIEHVRNELAIINERLERKIIVREKAGAQAVILWHKLRRLERKLRDMNYRQEDVLALNLQQKINEVDRLRQKYLEMYNCEPRPSNEEIARLLVMPKKKVKQISVILFRVREKLCSK